MNILKMMGGGGLASIVGAIPPAAIRSEMVEKIPKVLAYLKEEVVPIPQYKVGETRHSLSFIESGGVVFVCVFCHNENLSQFRWDARYKVPELLGNVSDDQIKVLLKSLT